MIRSKNVTLNIQQIDERSADLANRAGDGKRFFKCKARGMVGIAALGSPMGATAKVSRAILVSGAG